MRKITSQMNGIPVLCFHFKWDENEIKTAKDMQGKFKAMVAKAGRT